MDKVYWQERLQAYLDNELEPADRKAFEQHMLANPEIAEELRFTAALKKRLSAYCDSVVIPPQVEARIRARFGQPKKPLKPNWILAASAIAAVLLLALFLPRLQNQTLTFEPGSLQGKLVCYGCEVAERAQIAKGTICDDGHEMALLCPNGELWRFASDGLGVDAKKDLTLANQRVQVVGMFQNRERLIRVQSIDAATTVTKATIAMGSTNQ